MILQKMIFQIILDNTTIIIFFVEDRDTGATLVPGYWPNTLRLTVDIRVYVRRHSEGSIGKRKIDTF